MNIRKWITPVLLAMGLFGVVGLAGDPAHAQAGKCGQRPLVLKIVKDKMKLTRSAIGLFGTDGGAMMELYTNPAGRWIMLMTDAKKLTCIMAHGTSLETIKPKVPSGPDA